MLGELGGVPGFSIRLSAALQGGDEMLRIVEETLAAFGDAN